MIIRVLFLAVFGFSTGLYATTLTLYGSTAPKWKIRAIGALFVTNGVLAALTLASIVVPDAISRIGRIPLLITLAVVFINALVPSVWFYWDIKMMEREKRRVIRSLVEHQRRELEDNEKSSE